MKHELDLIWLVLSLFVPTFVCSTLLRANGVRGLLALIGLIAITVYLFADFEGWQLAIATISALVGLALGGKLSDHLEYTRSMRATEAERAKRRKEMGPA